jgi:hypothetical protein
MGTNAIDLSYGVSADRLGGIYVTGVTQGSLDGHAAGKNGDLFLCKYDAVGNLIWTRQSGKSYSDSSYSVAVDGFGNAYITGETWGTADGIVFGSPDFFVAKFNSNGDTLWSQLFHDSHNHAFSSVTTDSMGNAYVSGSDSGQFGAEPFVTEFDAHGTRNWNRAFPSGTFNYASGISADRLGNVFVTSYSYDVVSIRKLDIDGTPIWNRTFTSSGQHNGYSVAVAADGLGNVYIAGTTAGSLGGTNAGLSDAFIRKYDASGSVVWTRQFGTSAADYCDGVSADRSGNVYIVGSTTGSLAAPNAGDFDAFVAKFDSSGDLSWTKQLGTNAADYSDGISADGLGNVYMTGHTLGSLGSPNFGSYDAFVVKISDVPEPNTLSLVAIGGIGLMARLRRSLYRPVGAAVL